MKVTQLNKSFFFPRHVEGVIVGRRVREVGAGLSK